ncbi:MAG: hypothetical protein JNL98_22380 [Bryobacterales bacterium]|nr:hypothetical protein [Bryobacterales bacterium]
MKRVTVFVCMVGLLACTKTPPAAVNPESKTGLTAANPAAEPPSGAAPVASAPAASATAAAPAAPAAPAPELVLPAGTPIRVMTTSTISTKSNKSGEAFEGSLYAPITVDGKVLLPKGTPVRGVIAESDPGGRVKGRARLSLRLSSIDVNGKKVVLASNTYVKQAPGTKRRDAAKIGIGSGAGAAIGAIAGGGAGAAIGAAAGAGAGTGMVLVTRGEPAVIPSESVVGFRLREAVKF